MLGRAIRDPHAVESPIGEAAGLDVLPVVTTFAPAKTTRRARARVTAAWSPFAAARDVVADAYEIHAGDTRVLDDAAASPFTVVERGGAPAAVPEGAAMGLVAGTYLHGVLASGPLRRALLEWLAVRAGHQAHSAWGRGEPRVARWDRLADVVAGALDVQAIAKLLRLAI